MFYKQLIKKNGMGNSSSPDRKIEIPADKPKCPMCVCKDERKARDLCILEHGEEACEEKIKTLNACLRQYGFDFPDKKK